MPADIRKLIVQVDETRIEMGRPIEPPTRRALAIAVIANPFAGRYVENLDELIAIGEELGGLLGDKCIAALGIEPSAAESYGKAAIVGEAGELEHAAAILHPKLGAPLRRAVEKGAALVPSAKKRGGLGTAIDVPLGHKDAAFVRSHFDAIEARVSDAPRANEIVRGTAGPGELTAAALAENNRAELVGEKTFGEGTQQKTFELPDGAALILSVAKYESPSGKKLQDDGVTPGVLVAGNQPEAEGDDDSAQPTDTANKNAPTAAKGAQGSKPAEVDDQLNKALDLLKGKAA